MKVLITGSSGFIGTPIRKLLEKKGFEVIGYDLSEGNDILEATNLDHAVSQVDYVIHMAAILGTDKTVRDSSLARKAIDVNIIGGFNVIESCLRHDVKLITMDNGNWWMDNPYSASKHFINQIVRAWVRSRGLKASIVRAYNAYGIGQSTLQNKFAPNFITQALKGENLLIYGDGQNTMDAVHVNDVARVIVDVLESSKFNGSTFQAGTGVEMTVEEVAKEVIRMTGSKSRLEFIDMRPGEEENARVYADSPYLLDRYITLEEGMPETIEYYKELNDGSSKG